jgi:hypothetical protein
LALCAKSAMISTGSWPAPSALSGCKNSRENAALFQKPAITREVRHLQIPAKPCPGSVSGAHWRGTQTHRKGHPQWHNVAAKAENSPSRRFPSSPGTPTAPPPPKGLTAGERRVWRTITEAMRPDWYNPAFGPVLVAHVREAEAGDALARRLRACAIGSREYTVMAAALRASTKNQAQADPRCKWQAAKHPDRVHRDPASGEAVVDQRQQHW